jgi:CheY-like chemotaxis protein
MRISADPVPGRSCATVASPMTSLDPLTRILVLEDEVLISIMIEDVFTIAGYHVMCAATVVEATSLIATTLFHAAVLDVGLRGGPNWKVAESLLLRKVPFLFCTGSALPLAEQYGHVPIVPKPFLEADLLDAVSRLLAAK